MPQMSETLRFAVKQRDLLKGLKLFFLQLRQWPDFDPTGLSQNVGASCTLKNPHQYFRDNAVFSCSLNWTRALHQVLFLLCFSLNNTSV